MKIAIVGAKDSVEKVYRIGRTSYGEHEFVPFAVGLCDYCDEVLNRCEEIADGLIFTGLGFVNITKKLHILSIPVEFITRDGSCIIKTFWDMQQQRLRPKRISMDVVGEPLFQDVCEELDLQFEKSYLFPYNPEQIEEELMIEHQKLWVAGKIDMAITSYGWIYDQLREAKVPVVRLGVTAPIIRNSLDRLIARIENQEMKKSQLAVQMITIEAKQDYNRYEYEALRKRNVFERMLIDYLPVIQGTVTQNQNDQYTIISTRGAIDSLMGKEAFLKIITATEKENIRLYAGVGFGHTAFDADFNARTALKRSRQEKGNAYYIVDAKKRVIGPIGDRNILAYESASLEEVVQRVARETGLSTTYISKLINLTKKLDTDLVDSKKLAELLKVTERSARRILKKLVDAGCAQVATSSQQNAVGRPLLIYKISIS
jgi:predicted transcriptional regulator